MKSHVFKTVVLALVIALVFLYAMTSLREQQRNRQLETVGTAFDVMLKLGASAMNDGYFSWSEVRNVVEAGDLQTAADLVSDIESVYPFVGDIQIQRGEPPEAAYEILGENDKVILSFGLKNDFGFEPLPGWKALVILDVQRILDSLGSERNLIVDAVKGKPIGYSIKARFGGPVLSWLDLVLVFLAALAVSYPASVGIWRKNIYFYESKGLESIIYLFEQTEKVSASHSRRVAAFALFLGLKLGYAGKQLRDIYTAALLHDIGKISVPTPILLKEGTLTKTELQSISVHPIISARILRNFKELSHLSQAVLYHHERMDGSGYPESLKGEDIPEIARIIAVVDVFEALIGFRPYRQPLKTKEAFEILKAMPLDQRIVEVFESEYPSFARFTPPRWAVSYERVLEKL
jgi:HD-GYP domain-containing protein (c-di-GMP phosphodiesterase class II)